MEKLILMEPLAMGHTRREIAVPLILFVGLLFGFDMRWAHALAPVPGTESPLSDRAPDEQTATDADKKQRAALIAALNGPEDSRTAGRIRRLVEHGTMASEAIPRLIELMNSDDGYVRYSAAKALATIGVRNPLVNAAFKTALAQNIDPQVRILAAEGLPALGYSARDALPALLDALKDQNPNVRSAAITTVGGFGARAATAVPALMAMLNDPGMRSVQITMDMFGERPVRHDVAEALSHIGPSADAACCKLHEIMAADGDDEMRVVAAQAIHQISGSSKAVLAHLRRLRRSKSKAAREASFCALADMGEDVPSVLPDIVRGLHDSDPTIRWYALISLADMNDAGASALPLIKRMAIHDSDESVREEAKITAARLEAGLQTK